MITLMIVLFGALFFFLGYGIPIAVAIGFATLVTFIFSDVPVLIMVQRLYAGIDSFTLMAIPFFMLAGALMETGGMSRRLVRFANALVGTIAGGLAHVQVLGSSFFAALSGSSPATTAAIGAALIPEMNKQGYPKNFSAAVQAVAGTIGTIIPPSIPMVLFAVCANVSIGKLFMAGMIPGIIYGFGLMCMIYYIAKKEKFAQQSAAKFSFKELWDSFKDAVWALLVPVIILGGIYTGIFTPTEAGAVAAAYGLLAGSLIYKELSFKLTVKVFITSAVNVSMVLLIVSCASAFSWLLNMKGVASMIGAWFGTVSSSPAIFLLLVIMLLLAMGCFMECAASVLMITPVLMPAAKLMGIDPIHFGVVVVMTLSLGMATPPVGENLYIAASIAGIKFESLLKYAWRFIAVAIVAILLVTYVPAISLFLPNLFLK
ncbi:TRAP transporter large permease subunit [Deltaproteobacteria bacterium OttesenSCG-928-M10]|nr:TRAP transporter large permease subunit [Deltaproteobacteria bacterium OttesenSCG-928-M10]